MAGVRVAAGFIGSQKNPTQISKADLQRTAALAEQLQLPFFAEPVCVNLQASLPAEQQSFDLLLHYVDQTLYLHAMRGAQQQSICVDFSDASFLWRQKQALASESVVKAVGGKKALNLNIVDATAGLGQDSFILALFGFNVHLIEASPVVHALLADGLLRAMESGEPALLAAANRIQLSLGDSRLLLPKLEGVDIICLDPMFPERRKSAQVKKSMQVLQQLLGHDDEPVGLLEVCLLKASRRVVVKRPRHSNWLDASKPSLEITGKSSRFDIYLL
jgi:16S rRNA (guanine1516-N2)-methyltransferase